METTIPSPTASDRLEAGFAAVRSLDLSQAQEPTRKAALEIAEIVRTLDADEDVVIAAMLQPLMEEKLLDRDAAERQFGEAAVQLARALSQLGRFGLPADWTPDRGLESSQAEALRKMLVAVVGDVRLVVVKLAEQLQRMRTAKSLAWTKTKTKTKTKRTKRICIVMHRS